VLAGLFLLEGYFATAEAERIFFAGYKGGFYIRSEEEGGMELRLGGAFQADYRHYLESQRADNRFDIRRARLKFAGSITRWFRFGLEYEFQGSETSNLVDAFGEGVHGGQALRMGQFKVPFSLEWQTRDKGLYFAERSFGYCLGPERDVGVMLHGSLLTDTLHYGVGLFNGDGEDGSSRGSQEDDPELAGRAALAPFGQTSLEWLRGVHLGASATYATIDTANIDVKVKSVGMAGTNRNIYVLGHNTKFGVIQDVGDRRRLGLEAAYTLGPFALMGEFTQLHYSDLKPAGSATRDADFSAWYISAVLCLTGEPIVISGGKMKPLYPRRFFNPGEGTYGALCLAVRMEQFQGDEEWINPEAYVSVEGAQAYSLALNWILFPMQRLVFDFSHTSLSDPIRVRVQPDGSVDYIEEENVFTLRFSLDF
jgi:phosphate-selective porin OprO/OprP